MLRGGRTLSTSMSLWKPLAPAVPFLAQGMAGYGTTVSPVQPKTPEGRAAFEALSALRSAAPGKKKTVGLPDAVVCKFLDSDKELSRAIRLATAARPSLEIDLKAPEEYNIPTVQGSILNFYLKPSVNPYIPLGAAGSWIITAYGAVVHDSGGYGMLGLGHAPESVLAAMSAPHVMANVMTPSVSQARLTARLNKEIGFSRKANACGCTSCGCSSPKYVFLNSGSESVTFTCRITDIHAKAMTGPGGPKAGRRPMRLAIVDGFHGRTEGAARLSHSCRSSYAKHLASFRGLDDILYTPVNDIAALRKTFADAEAAGMFIEGMWVEPVMGEGVPGLALARDFYDEARRLTKAHGSLLIVDSIQAALRAHGCLSIIDYAGYETAACPDMETYSKALNAGQFPLSVIALSEEVAGKYQTGLYGNTMTGNPRAMEVGCAVLDAVTPALRKNIKDRGVEFVQKLQKLSDEHRGAIDQVVGTGLMVSAMLNPSRYQVLGKGRFEEYLRVRGIEMIHGGDTGLRFTPSFTITSAEIDMIIAVVREGLSVKENMV